MAIMYDQGDCRNYVLPLPLQMGFCYVLINGSLGGKTFFGVCFSNVLADFNLILGFSDDYDGSSGLHWLF